MQFGCFQADYPGLEGQMQAAKMSRWINLWWSVYDFSTGNTGPGQRRNFELIETAGDAIKTEFFRQGSETDLMFDKSAVPLIIGGCRSSGGGGDQTVETSVAVFYQSADQTLFEFLQSPTTAAIILQTKLGRLKDIKSVCASIDKKRLMGDEKFIAVQTKQPVGKWPANLQNSLIFTTNLAGDFTQIFRDVHNNDN
jgi:hypothetical protein